MKKIVHVVVSGYVEGLAYQENILPQKQKELGYDVYIVTSQISRNLSNREVKLLPQGKYVNKHGITVVVLRAVIKRWVRYVCGYWSIGLYEALCELSPDIIFVHDVFFKENKKIISYLKRHPNVVVYADNHVDYYNNPNKTIKQKITNYIFKKYAHELGRYLKVAWGTTPWRVDYLKDFYGIQPSKVDLLVMGGDEKLILGIDREDNRNKIRLKYGIPSDAFLLVSGGVIDKRKQQDILLAAVDTLVNENVWLILFGEPDEEMKNVCEYYRQKINICFTGWVDVDMSYRLFLASDLAVFPGTHSVLWEQAAACGIPEIIKHWSRMEHVNVNGNALLLDDISKETLCNSIMSIKKNYSEWYQKASEAAPSFYYIEIAKKSIEHNSH